MEKSRRNCLFIAGWCVAACEPKTKLQQHKFIAYTQRANVNAHRVVHARQPESRKIERNSNNKKHVSIYVVPVLNYIWVAMQRSTSLRPVCMRTLNCIDEHGSIDRERTNKNGMRKYTTELWKGTAPKARNKSKTLTFSFIPFLSCVRSLAGLKDLDFYVNFPCCTTKKVYNYSVYS